MRGGSWRDEALDLTTTRRAQMSENLRLDYVGIRLVHDVQVTNEEESEDE